MTEDRSSETRLRLGIIGLGSYFRYAYLTRLRPPSPLFAVVAVCQRNPNALQAVANELGSPTPYTGWQDLLTQSDLEAVLISTPHHLHAQQVRAALERGLHVLVDKPLCLDAAEAEDLLRLAQRQRRVLSVAYNYHYWSHFQAACAWIQAGRLGRVSSINCLGAARAEGSPILDPTSWYHDPRQSGGGSLISGGTHRLEAVFWLTGLQPRAVAARMTGPATGLDYQTGLLIELSNGAVATLINEAQGPDWRLEVTIFGERGAVLIRNHTLTILDANGSTVALDSLPAETDALADFHAAIVHGQPLLTSAEDGYWAVAAVQAAYAAATSGQIQAVRPLTKEAMP